MTTEQRIWDIVARMTDRGIDGILSVPLRTHHALMDRETYLQLIVRAAARQARWARG